MQGLGVVVMVLAAIGAAIVAPFLWIVYAFIVGFLMLASR